MGKQVKPARKAVFNTREAAAYLGFSVGALRYWRVRGMGPLCFRNGYRKLEYHQEDLDAWMKANYRNYFETETGARKNARNRSRK